MLVAANGAALQITPTVQNFTLKAGQKAKAKVVIVNTESSTINVTVHSQDWKAYPANKKIKTKDWLITDETPFSLKPGESRDILFTLDMPKKAVGEVMGMLSIMTTSPDRAQLGFKLSVAVYVMIEGTEIVKPDIDDISIRIGTNTTAGYVMHNRGNVHVRPRGRMQVLDKNDEVVANFGFLEEGPAHPSEPKAFFATISNFRLKPGRYTAVLRLTDADRNLPIPERRYKLTVDDQGKVDLN